MESVSDYVFYTNVNTSLGIRTSAKIKKNAKTSSKRGGADCGPEPLDAKICFRDLVTLLATSYV